MSLPSDVPHYYIASPYPWLISEPSRPEVDTFLGPCNRETFPESMLPHSNLLENRFPPDLQLLSEPRNSESSHHISSNEERSRTSIQQVPGNGHQTEASLLLYGCDTGLLSQKTFGIFTQQSMYENCIAPATTILCLENEPKPSTVLEATGNISVGAPVIEEHDQPHQGYVQVLGSSSQGRKNPENEQHAFAGKAPEYLKEWYDENRRHPYPNSKVREELQRKTGLEMKQIIKWFENARRRDPRHKREKSRLPPRAVEELEAWFNGHLEYPYPSPADRKRLLNNTGLPMIQIQSWFSNRRKKHKRENKTAAATMGGHRCMSKTV